MAFESSEDEVGAEWVSVKKTKPSEEPFLVAEKKKLAKQPPAKPAKIIPERKQKEKKEKALESSERQSTRKRALPVDSPESVSRSASEEPETKPRPAKRLKKDNNTAPLKAVCYLHLQFTDD